MKRDPIVLTGVVLGRAVASVPLDKRGLPMAASHDKEVTLTLQFPVPGHRAMEISMRVDSLPRGWMEIGDPVTMVVDSAKDTAVKSEPYSIAPVEAEAVES